MSLVFGHYPRGGGEMLLALALADHAHDDGTSIRPSISKLAEKTRQSERAVQYQLRAMEVSGWLQLVNNGNGGRNQTREYRINPDWINGANPAPIKGRKKGEKSAPIDTENGATDAPFNCEKGENIAPITEEKGCKLRQERVQIETEKGAKLLHPHRTIIEPSGIIRESEAHTRERIIADANRTRPAPLAPFVTAFRMSLDWIPDEPILQGHCASAGVSPDIVTREILAEFVNHWTDQPHTYTERQWIGKLVTSARRAPKPTRNPDPPGSFIERHTDTTWANDFVGKHADPKWREGL